MKCNRCGKEYDSPLCYNCLNESFILARQSGKSGLMKSIIQESFGISDNDLSDHQLNEMKKIGFLEQDIINIYEFYYEDLKFCGCGDPEEILEVIYTLWKNDDYKKRENMFGKLSYGVYTFIFNVLDNLEYMEHGSSIGGAWLTEKGKMVYTSLDKFFNTDKFELDEIFELYEYCKNKS